MMHFIVEGIEITVNHISWILGFIIFMLIGLGILYWKLNGGKDENI